MKLFVLAVATVVLVIAAVATSFHFFHVREDPILFHSQGPTRERLESLNHLATMRVYVADVLTAEGEGHRGAWLIRGDAILGVNLGQAKILEKSEETKQAVLSLPQPEILQCRVDHERTRTWEVRRTTWIPWSGDEDKLRDRVMLEAQKLVAHAAESSESLNQAKAVAEAVIRGFYEEVGWQVQVLWQKQEAKPIDASGPSLDQ